MPARYSWSKGDGRKCRGQQFRIVGLGAALRKLLMANKAWTKSMERDLTTRENEWNDGHAVLNKGAKSVECDVDY